MYVCDRVYSQYYNPDSSQTRDDNEFVELHSKCLQLLTRTISRLKTGLYGKLSTIDVLELTNSGSMYLTDWYNRKYGVDESEDISNSRESRIRKMQSRLCNLGVGKLVVSVVCSGLDELVSHALTLGIALLEGGNRTV